LQEVAHRLATGVRNYDSVGRYGGEEFLIVLPGCNASDLAATAARLCHSIAEYPIVTAVGHLFVTLSLGLASRESISPELPDREKLLRAADTTLYVAKALGRNQVASVPVAAGMAQTGP
jgi:two-component system cell cycle response regulator